MESVKDRNNVFTEPGVGEQAVSCILNHQKSMEGASRHASEKGVVLVKAGGD